MMELIETKEIIKNTSGMARPLRMRRRAKKSVYERHYDPDDTLDFTKEADKPRSKEALAMGVAALAELQQTVVQDKWAVLLVFQSNGRRGQGWRH